VVSDQRVNPTYTRDLARASLLLAESGVAGVVHLVAAGCCGWDEFARGVLEVCGRRVTVESVASSTFPTPAARPLNGCLASSRVEALRHWREALVEWAAERPD